MTNEMRWAIEEWIIRKGIASVDIYEFLMLHGQDFYDYIKENLKDDI